VPFGEEQDDVQDLTGGSRASMQLDSSSTPLPTVFEVGIPSARFGMWRGEEPMTRNIADKQLQCRIRQEELRLGGGRLLIDQGPSVAAVEVAPFAIVAFSHEPALPEI
jgi:hypothetical protein